MILKILIISLLQTYIHADPSQSGRVTFRHGEPNCPFPCGTGAICQEDSNGKATCRFFFQIYELKIFILFFKKVNELQKTKFHILFFSCKTGLIPVLTPLQGCVGCSNDSQCRDGKICEKHRCTSKMRRITSISTISRSSSILESCPKNVWPLPITLCRGRQQQKSQCWSPGSRDTDCPNHGLCCYDGCAYTCHSDVSSSTTTIPTTSTTTTTTTGSPPPTWFPCSTTTTTTTTTTATTTTISISTIPTTTLTTCWDNFQCPMGETCEMPWMICVKKIPCASMSKACEMLISIASKFNIAEDYISGICPVPCTL